MLEDLEQLLRLRMTGPMTNNTCQALAAVALSSPQSSLGVESFCEGVYEELVKLLGPITTVPAPAFPPTPVHVDGRTSCMCNPAIYVPGGCTNAQCPLVSGVWCVWNGIVRGTCVS